MTKMDLEAFRREDGGRRRSGDGGWVGVTVTVRVTVRFFIICHRI